MEEETREERKRKREKEARKEEREMEKEAKEEERVLLLTLCQAASFSLWIA